MNETTTSDGRTDRRTYLKLAGTGALAAGVAGCLGLGGTPSSQNDEGTADGEGGGGASGNDGKGDGDSGGGTSGNAEGAVPASFSCSQFLETRHYSRDKPTFTFQFVVPKNWEEYSARNSDSGSSIRMVPPVTEDTVVVTHSIEVIERRTPTERKIFVDSRTKFGGHEKLDPRPYGSGEMVVLYSESDPSTETNEQQASYSWILGLPTGTDGQVHIAKITGRANTLFEELPFCKEAVKKTTEKTVDSIQPK